MEIKAVVFDLDHTLYDRESSLKIGMESYYADCHSLFLDTCDLQTAREEMIRADHLGGHFCWEVTLAELVAGGKVFKNPPPRSSELRDYFQHQFGTKAVLYSYTLSTLQQLREMRLKLGLITNGNPDQQWGKIRRLGLEDQFERIMIGGNGETSKPNRIIFDRMAKDLGLQNSLCMYVGDNPLNDVDGARKAGYIPVWVRTMPWDFPEVEKPRLQVDGVDQLPQMIKTMLSK